ncbi:MAG: flagellar assembly peptidoglycan hydrolase FlgJ [Lysobacter sp.]|nr:MAG: flagellar assembly peptidoglycan hydrolase FlgJ [Lysobacter sp.]
MRLPSAISLDSASTKAASRPSMEKAAHELETQFAAMLIKSMRATTSGDPLGGDNTTYRDMYDQQLAKEMTKGRGLGLAPMIMRQLERSTGTAGVRPASGPMPLTRPATGFAMAPVASLMPARPGGLLELVRPASGVALPAASPIPAPPPTPTASGVPAGEAACGPVTPLDCSSPEAFVKSLWPHARKVAEQLGVSAKALVAQAALETGWGRRLIGRGTGEVSNNLFGIKASGSWKGSKINAGTHEYVAGTRHNQRADFRAYTSAADSFADYARLLSGARYAQARGAGEDTHRFASALQQAGYATDPSYANKITAIAEGATMRRALAALGDA